MEQIKIKNDNGEEKSFDVIFDFISKNDNQKYIVYTDFEKDENNTIKCYSSIFDEGKLLPVQNKEEIAFIESTINTLELAAKNKYEIFFK